MTNKKSILLLEENEFILVNGLACRVLAIDVTNTGKTAKVFYERNGVAETMRVGTSTFLEVVEEIDSKTENTQSEIIDPSSNVVSIFQRKDKLQSALELLSKDYQEYFKVVEEEFKLVHEFYLKHILTMPSMVRKSLELTMDEMKQAKEHIQEKHLTDIGTPLPKGF